jgi:SAM-dependent methyltransferase
MEHNPQREHYLKIHDEYSAHYYDDTSAIYREQIIYETLFRGVDLDGATIADLACGDGVNSEALLNRFPKAKTVGFDISSKACHDYQRRIGATAVEIDLIEPIEPGHEVFDAAMIVGGLHHCVLGLETALNNISKLIKPGGGLLLCEPNADFVLESLREYWYKKDRYFEQESENALHHDEIYRMVAHKFKLVDVTYIGGPAYFIILNSLILRVPLRLKRFLLKPLMFIEKYYNSMSGKKLSPSFIAHWIRR